jgi:hypothetical protein
MIRPEADGLNDEGGIDMTEKWTWRRVNINELMATVIALVLFSLGGCAGEAPKPASPMTPEQVRSNADKAFDKLKQEEKNRAVGSETVPY